MEGRTQAPAPAGLAASHPVRIERVELLGRESSQLVDCRLARPEPGWESEQFAVEVHGWAIPSSSRLERVEVVCYEEVLREASLEEAPPGVQRAFPDEPQASESGFHTVVGALRLPLEFELIVRATLANGETVDLAAITGSRRSLRPAEPTGDLRPAIVLSPTGRSGTTWSVQLLRQHPALVAHPPFGVEPRLASYWLEAASALAEPASYMRCLRPRMQYDNWWLGDWPEASKGVIRDEVIGRFLGQESVERFADLARERVEAFYRVVAEQQGKEPEFFVEKGPLGRLRLEAMADLYPGMRQVIIFRDPRDTVCSILSYREKRPDAQLVSEGDVDDNFMEDVARGFRGMLSHASKLADRAATVRYEDLIQSPVTALEPVLESLGVDSSPAVIEAMIHQAEADFPRMKRHLTSDSVEASIGRWHRDMDDDFKARANEIFGDVLVKLGYV